MTVREFTSRMWYMQKVVVIKWKKFDPNHWNPEQNIDPVKTAEELAEYVGTPHKLRSINYNHINDMLVDSYGAIDGTIIIEVH